MTDTTRAVHVTAACTSKIHSRVGFAAVKRLSREDLSKGNNQRAENHFLSAKQTSITLRNLMGGVSAEWTEAKAASPAEEFHAES